MKPPILLKTILDFCFYLLALSLIMTPIMLLFNLNSEDLVGVELNGRSISNWTYASSAIFIFEFGLSILSVYVIYLIRKLIRNFFKNKFFTRLQIALFNLIGQLIVLTAIGNFLSNLFSMIFLENRGEFSITIDSSFGGILFELAMGLFFVYLGKLFENARHLKEEHELTV